MEEPDLYLLLHLQQTLLAGAALSTLPDSVWAAAGNGTLAFTVANDASQAFVNTGAVRGLTKSRLDEVRGYDPARPYITGQHGVTAITETSVTYLLDGISYVTRLADGLTTYSFGYVAPVLAQQAVAGDERFPFHERHPEGPAIEPQRSNRAVLPDFYAIARATSLEQLPGFLS